MKSILFIINIIFIDLSLNAQSIYLFDSNRYFYYDSTGKAQSKNIYTFNDKRLMGLEVDFNILLGFEHAGGYQIKNIYLSTDKGITWKLRTNFNNFSSYINIGEFELECYKSYLIENGDTIPENLYLPSLLSFFKLSEKEWFLFGDIAYSNSDKTGGHIPYLIKTINAAEYNWFKIKLPDEVSKTKYRVINMRKEDNYLLVDLGYAKEVYYTLKSSDGGMTWIVYKKF